VTLSASGMVRAARAPTRPWLAAPRKTKIADGMPKRICTCWGGVKATVHAAARNTRTRNSASVLAAAAAAAAACHVLNTVTHYTTYSRSA
jgi:hypothetical protein